MSTDPLLLPPAWTFALLALLVSAPPGGGPPAAATGPRAAQADDGGLEPLALEGLRPATEDDGVFVELELSADTCYVGQPLLARLRVGFERGLLSERMVQPFRRRLDVPAQVLCPWLDGLACADALEREAPAGLTGARLASFALGRSVERAQLVDLVRADGRAYVVLELERELVPTCPGPLVLEETVVRLAWASAFEDDVFSGRRPVDRIDAVARGGARTLAVRPLPEAGRPPGSTGAVGSFRVSAELEASSAVVGRSLQLVLRWSGEGNLTRFETPRLGALAGWRVVGWLDDRARPTRTIRYDVAPTTTAVRELPALSFAYFDPTPPGAWRTATTEPVAVRVVARSDPEPAPPVSDDAALPERSPPGPSAGRRLLAALALVLLALVVLVARARARRPAPAPPAPDEARARAQRAAAAFHARRRQEGAAADPTDALTEFLAACLGCPVPAVIARDLPRRLVAAGFPEELARRSAALLDELTSARYGGAAVPEGARRAGALVEAVAASCAA